MHQYLRSHIIHLKAFAEFGRAMDDLMQKSCDVLLFVMRNCMENSVVVKTWMTESYQVKNNLTYDLTCSIV